MHRAGIVEMVTPLIILMPVIHLFLQMILLFRIIVFGFIRVVRTKNHELGVHMQDLLRFTLMVVTTA